MRHHPHFWGSRGFTYWASSCQYNNFVGTNCQYSSSSKTTHRALSIRDLASRKYSKNVNAFTGRNFSSLTLYDSLSESYKSLPLSIPLSMSKEPKGESLFESSTSKPELGLAWYTCGPTVYDSAHLGHARTYVSLDIIQRALLHNHKLQLSIQNSQSKQHLEKGVTPIPPPIFIMNVTDVDDKILTRAKEQNIPPLQLARKFEQEFWEDMDALNVMRPTVVTRVTDHIESSIIPYIEKIERNGMAYVIDDDGVYFDVRAFESIKGCLNRYGKLSSLKRESEEGDDDTFFAWDNADNEDREEKAGNSSPKKDPRDFVLWKRRESVDTESHDDDSNSNSNSKREELCWDSPWGKGRPGWHIECSAMIESTMQAFDQYKIHVHAGGVDLKFPHHTNEIAQAEAYMHPRNEEEWIPHWVHTGHLHIDGLKMSKSLKNFITIRDILETTSEGEFCDNEDTSSSFHSPADDFRLWCLGLSGSYRGPATYSKSRLVEAKVTREKILRFLIDGEQWLRQSKSSENCNTYSANWTNEDHDLVQLASTCQVSCHRALLGLSSNSQEGSEVTTCDDFDFDGSSYLKSTIDLAEAGSRHTAEALTGERPLYPVEHALGVLRDCLAIVGFSDDTVRAGLSRKLEDNIVGGNEALVNELVEFRSTIREEALDCLQNSNTSKDSQAAALSKMLLKTCDDLRDKNLPAIGIEVFDAGDTSPTWRFGAPTSRTSFPSEPDMEMKENNDEKRKRPDISATQDTNMANFFRVGRHEGSFLAFDCDGVPTHNADGSELSRRMLKKLVKKRDAFFRKRAYNAVHLVN
jgi:cysteinyl-tRNA synthetase